MRHAAVAPRVAALRDDHADAGRGTGQRADVTQAMVVRELASIAFFDVRKLFNGDGSLKRVQELDDATAAALASIEVVDIGPGGQMELSKKFKSPEKLKALDLLGTHLGMFAKKTEDSAAADPLRKAVAQMPAERAEGMLKALIAVKAARETTRHGAD